MANIFENILIDLDVVSNDVHRAALDELRDLVRELYKADEEPTDDQALKCAEEAAAELKEKVTKADAWSEDHSRSLQALKACIADLKKSMAH